MKIVTAAVNSPMFIEIQYCTLKKYVKGDYEFIVFNDAKGFPDFSNFNDPTLRVQIAEVCAKFNITCINIPNEHHRYMNCPSTRTAESMNYILNYQRQYPDKYLVLDSDMFLVDYFDVHKYDAYECMVMPQSRINRITGEMLNYIWNGIYYFDTTKLRNMDLVNWYPSAFCDTGGMMQEWLKRQPTETMYVVPHLLSGQWDESDIPSSLKDNIKLIEFLKTDDRVRTEQHPNKSSVFFCELYDNAILHYRSGGNWRGEGSDKHKLLTEKLKQALVN